MIIIIELNIFLYDIFVFKDQIKTANLINRWCSVTKRDWCTTVIFKDLYLKTAINSVGMDDLM